MPKPTFSKVPGDGRDRITQRTELTQAFDTGKAQPGRVVRPNVGLVPAAVPSAGNAGSADGLVTLQMPTGFLTNGSTGAVMGRSFSVTVSVEGMVKGYRNGFVRAIPYVDYEPGLGFPIGNNYHLASNTSGFRFWEPRTLSGPGGATGNVPLAKITAPGADGILTVVDGHIVAIVMPT